MMAFQEPLLFSVQILAVLNFSPILRNVVRAVQGPIVQLAMCVAEDESPSARFMRLRSAL